MIKLQKDTKHIVTLTFDQRGKKTNIINHKIDDVLLPVIEYLEQEKSQGRLRGVIITSAKKGFLQGGELDYLYKEKNAKVIFEMTERLKSLYRRLELLNVPIVAAINGSALGTGYEFALVCHHRIALDDFRIKIGLPEVNLGFIPSSGGVVRLTWMLGLEAFEILTQGKLFSPQKALERGLIDAIQPDEGALMEAAKEWIEHHPKPLQIWDAKNGEHPFSNIKSPKVARWIKHTTAYLAKTTKYNYPAQQAIFNIMTDGMSLNFDTASRISSRQFAHLMVSQTTKNMTKAFWYDLMKIKKGISRPRGFGKFRPRKVGIIGAGIMGCGIAYTCAAAGMQVILKDVSKPIADRGKKRIDIIVKQELNQYRLTKEVAGSILGSITTTNSAKDFDDCDLVIEAVFENEAIKAKVIKEAEQYLDEYAFIGTTTSSLSISRLSKSAISSENFIGLRFFSPAQQMPLVEIIKGNKTSEETLGRAFDFVRAIGKVPIVVNDRRGFYTVRVTEMYAIEGISLLLEGVPPAVVERVGINMGMSQGPLEMLDELSLAQLLKFEESKLKVIGAAYYHKKELEVLRHFVNDLNRKGKTSKAGFYEYDDDGNKKLWEGLQEEFNFNHDYDLKEIEERLFFIQSLEALRCIEKEVLDTEEEANIGSIFGWGFPSYKGGVLQYIEDYGKEKFIKRAAEYEKRLGKKYAYLAEL